MAVHMNLRLPEDILAHLDATAARMERDNPGQRVTRSDVARRCLIVGMETVCGPMPEEPATPAESPKTTPSDDVQIDPNLANVFEPGVYVTDPSRLPLEVRMPCLDPDKMHGAADGFGGSDEGCGHSPSVAKLRAELAAYEAEYEADPNTKMCP
jgi:hypothetical protein